MQATCRRTAAVTRTFADTCERRCNCRYSTAAKRAAASDAATKVRAPKRSTWVAAGCGWRPARDLPLGTVLLLRFRLPNVDREMVMRGRIVLSFYKADVKRFFHGIAFTQIDPADQAHIIEYVEERARGQSP